MPEGSHSVHIPLPEGLYRGLREAATASRRSLSDVVREAVGAWLREWERERVQRELREYVKAVAGTVDDLDVDLERAALETWESLDE